MWSGLWDTEGGALRSLGGAFCCWAGNQGIRSPARAALECFDGLDVRLFPSLDAHAREPPRVHGGACGGLCVAAHARGGGISSVEPTPVPAVPNTL